MDRKRTAAYCRVSTASDMQDGSFETQVEYYRARITEDPQLELVEVYGDHGKSGTEMRKRPEFMRMLKDCEDGKIDLILTKSVSRFARNMKDCVETVRKLRALGVTVHFEKEGFHTGDLQCELILSIMATIAEQESISLSQNVKWSREHCNRKGNYIEKQPYGYDKQMPDHIWTVNENEARRVRLAFWMACNGYKYKNIMDELNRIEEAEGTGKVWYNTPVSYMLSNISYTGDIITNKGCSIVTPEGKKTVKNDGIVDQYYIEGHHEPLVSHAVFDIVQELAERHLLYASRTIYSESDEQLFAQAARIADKELGDLKGELYAGK